MKALLTASGLAILGFVGAAHAGGVVGLTGDRPAPAHVAAAPGPGAITAMAGAACDPSWLPTFGGNATVISSIWALTVFDDGGGPALYAGGDFSNAGGVEVNHIAKWEGTSWSALGTGMNDSVLCLAVFDDGLGGGPALYAGGYFTTAGGHPANGIAKWNGTSWAPLGTGLTGGTPVAALTVFDDGFGGGPALYAGGYFLTAGGVSANRIAKWDGASWSALGGGMSGNVYALRVFDGALCAAGSFTSAFDSGDSYLARWGCEALPPACPWDCGDGNGQVATADFLALLTQWGQVGAPCDFDGGGVTTADFLALLSHWGPCP